jgi:hypothetical protein
VPDFCLVTLVGFGSPWPRSGGIAALLAETAGNFDMILQESKSEIGNSGKSLSKKTPPKPS